MMTNTETPTFRGVACLHCKLPIPVPAVVSNQRVPADDADPAPRKSQVFNLRCPHCHKEKPYRTREIVDFEGTPESYKAPERPEPVRWYPQSGLAKTAKA